MTLKTSIILAVVVCMGCALALRPDPIMAPTTIPLTGYRSW